MANICRANRKFQLLVMVDDNTRVGSVLSEAIGPEESDKDNCNGQLMRNFLERVGMYAMNTFAKVGLTWRSSLGQMCPHRLYHG